MAALNKVMIIGNIGRDPESKYLANGDAVTNISVATTEKWTTKDGEKKEQTEWHRVTFFGRIAEVVAEYTSKGSAIYVEGKLRTRKYEKEGQTHYATEIIGERMQLLGGGGKREENEDSEPVAKPKSKPKAAEPEQADIDDDDIPF